MKIVDLATFLAYPDGVVFAEFNPAIVGEIQIRGQAWIESNLRSSCYQEFGLFDTEVTPCDVGSESEVVTDQYFRNGPGLNEKQLYAIFDKKDIDEVIQRLQRAYHEAKE